MAKLGRMQYVGWVTETTAGDNPSVANTDYHLAEDVSVSYEADEIERVGNLGSLDGMAKVTGGISSTISFATELKGAGSDVAPQDLPLWKASGFSTAQSAYPYTIAQDSTPTDTVTIVYWADGIRWILCGCQGTFTIDMEAGNIGKINWTFTGLMRRLPEDATNPTPDYNTTVPPVLQSTTFTVGGETDYGICRTISLDMGNEVSKRRSMTGSDAKAFGYEVPQITRRMGTGSMTVEMPTIAAFDWMTKWKDKTKLDVSLTVGSAGTHNKIIFDWDMVLNTAPTPADSDGLLMYDISFDLVTDDLSGNDSFSIQHTNS
jgi:hypothetical protein